MRIPTKKKKIVNRQLINHWILIFLTQFDGNVLYSSHFPTMSGLHCKYMSLYCLFHVLFNSQLWVALILPVLWLLRTSQGEGIHLLLRLLFLKDIQFPFLNRKLKKEIFTQPRWFFSNQKEYFFPSFKNFFL